MIEAFDSNNIHLSNRKDASKYVADIIAAAISRAVKRHGNAVIFLSGGSTPQPAYIRLSEYDLPWDQVHIGLVDDRCVGLDNAGSNQAMIRRTLLQNNAANAQLTGFVDDAIAPCSNIDTLNGQMAELTKRIDFCLMGMGPDGHTASWFPGAAELEAALDINMTKTAIRINATGCPGAGDYPRRVTLTLPAIMRAQEIALLITGNEKAEVLAKAANQSVFNAPVKALLAAGPRLTTIWAP